MVPFDVPGFVSSVHLQVGSLGGLFFEVSFFVVCSRCRAVLVVLTRVVPLLDCLSVALFDNSPVVGITCAGVAALL